MERWYCLDCDEPFDEPGTFIDRNHSEAFGTRCCEVLETDVCPNCDSENVELRDDADNAPDEHAARDQELAREIEAEMNATRNPE